MSLAERIEQMEPRERQLLNVLVAVFAGFVVLLVPFGVSAMLGSVRGDNQELREALNGIHAGRGDVGRRKAEREATIERYAKKAPALAGYLANLAKANGVDIPESQDRADVPHGKNYVERSTKIVIKKVSLLNLTKFMEAIAQSPHPLSISRYNIRKRGTEQDSYDVEMVVSAFDRKEPEKKTASEDTSSSEDE